MRTVSGDDNCLQYAVTRGVWLIGCAAGVLHSLLVRLVYRIVPEPYMDEVFHVDQTQRYCSRTFTWNPKITTPPALYVLSVPLFCGSERYTNSALIPFTFIGAIRFQRLFRKSSSSTFPDLPSVLNSLVILLLPVLFHSSLLYYTDLLSLTSLLWAASLPPGIFSTLIFAFSLCARQTNIIWAAAYGFIHLSISLRKCGKLTLSSVLAGLLHLRSLLLLPIGFVVFFMINGYSVVLGDHSAHRPVPHFMQIYYFLVFLCFSAAPLFVFSSKTYQCVRQIARSPVRFLISCFLITSCVHFFTFEHPYLLADNRHFTFYVWRRWFLRHPCCKYVTVFLYIVVLQLFSQTMAHIPRVFASVYILGTAAVLIPAHLLEPRYFIVPYVFWRLCHPERRVCVIAMESLYQILINTIVLYLFLFTPFEWLHEPGTKQRFMW